MNASHMNIMDQSRELSLEKPQNASYVTPNDSQVIDVNQIEEMNQRQTYHTAS